MYTQAQIPLFLLRVYILYIYRSVLHILRSLLCKYMPLLHIYNNPNPAGKLFLACNLHATIPYVSFVVSKGHMTLLTCISFDICLFWQVSLLIYFSFDMYLFWYDMSLLTCISYDICLFWHVSLLIYVSFDMYLFWYTSLLTRCASQDKEKLFPWHIEKHFPCQHDIITRQGKHSKEAYTHTKETRGIYKRDQRQHDIVARQEKYFSICHWTYFFLSWHDLAKARYHPPQYVTRSCISSLL